MPSVHYIRGILAFGGVSGALAAAEGAQMPKVLAQSWRVCVTKEKRFWKNPEQGRDEQDCPLEQLEEGLSLCP